MIQESNPTTDTLQAIDSLLARNRPPINYDVARAAVAEGVRKGWLRPAGCPEALTPEVIAARANENRVEECAAALRRYLQRHPGCAYRVQDLGAAVGYHHHCCGKALADLRAAGWPVEKRRDRSTVVCQGDDQTA